MGRPVSPSLLRRCPVTGKSYVAQEFVYWQPLTEDALVQLRRDLPAHDMGASECEHEVRLADDQLTRGPPASSASAHAFVSTQDGHVGGGRAAPRSRPFGGDPLGTQTTACELELGRGKWDAQSQTVLADRRDDRVVCSGQAGVSSTADWTGSSTQTHPRPPARSAAERPHGRHAPTNFPPCNPGISWPADGCTRGNPSATCRSGMKGPVQAGGAGAATTHELVGERDVIGLERGRDVGLGVGQYDGGEGLAGGGEGGVVDARDACAESCHNSTTGGEVQFEMVQCAVAKGSWRCRNLFPFQLAYFRGQWQPLKNCEHHRARVRNANKTDQGRARAQRARQTPNGKASATRSMLRQKTDETVKQQRRDWKKTPKGKACASRARLTDAGVAREKRARANTLQKRKDMPGRKMLHKIQCRVRDMLRQRGEESLTVIGRTSIPSSDALREHVESTFQEGMTWDNHGHRGALKWNLGHRIACSMYEATNDEDMRRCWALPNLFAQWSLENQGLSVQLPDDEELLLLRPHWPLAWHDMLPGAEERAVLQHTARNAFGKTRVLK